jgi:hypothetical protein
MQVANHENMKLFRTNEKHNEAPSPRLSRSASHCSVFGSIRNSTPRISLTHSTQINSLYDRARMANCRYKTSARQFLSQRRLSVTTVNPEGANSFQECHQSSKWKDRYHNLAMFSARKEPAGLQFWNTERNILFYPGTLGRDKAAHKGGRVRLWRSKGSVPHFQSVCGTQREPRLELWDLLSHDRCWWEKKMKRFCRLLGSFCLRKNPNAGVPNAFSAPFMAVLQQLGLLFRHPTPHTLNA